MTASQDYRDGMASGVTALVNAVAKVELYGIPVTLDLIRNVAAEIRSTMGGQVYPFWPDETSSGSSSGGDRG